MFWKKQHELFLYHCMAKILFETGNIAQLEDCLLSMDKALSLIQNSTRTHTRKRKDVGILSEQAVFDMGGGGAQS